MKISVISLASQAARWAAVKAQFDAVGLSPVREKAVSGRALLTSQHTAGLYCERLNARQYHRMLSPGEIGCYASHLAVWRQLLASSDSCMAVFEDDVEVGVALPSVLQAIERLPTGWDLVKLIGRHPEKVSLCTALLPQCDLIEYRRVPSFTSAYVVNRSGARKLLAHRRPFGRPVDVDLRHWWECDLQVAGVQPYPVRHAPSSRYSTIENRHIRPNLSMRLRKVLLQAQYSLLNQRACNERARRAQEAGGSALLAQAASSHRHDAR